MNVKNNFFSKKKFPFQKIVVFLHSDFWLKNRQ